MLESPRYHRTPQREAILGHVSHRRAHLSAEEIHAALRRRHPRLSMSSVYRNLHILVAQGKLQVLRFGSGQDLYDARTDVHYHLLCRSCGELRDLEVPALAGVDAEIQSQVSDFQVEGHTLVFHGLCQTCQTRARSPQV
jgi:Fe2+ or Zn2+ uptake regulation protein